VPISGSPVPPPRSAPPKQKPAAAPPAAPTIPVAMPVYNSPPATASAQELTADADNPFAAAFNTRKADDASSSMDLAFEPGSTGSAAEFRRNRPRRKRRGPSLLLIGLVAVIAVPVFCGGLGTAVAWYLRVFQGGDSGLGIADVPDTSGQLNFNFRKPGDPWQQDKDLQVKMKLHFAMKRTKPDDNFALLGRDYKTRTPSEAELREEALTRLKTYLPDSLETETKPASDKTHLGGQPARVLEFSGMDEQNVLMNGECYMLTYQGYAYWFFTWGPASERDAIQPEWDKLRKGFTIGNNRAGWTETGRATEIARNSSGSKIRFTLKPVKGLWKTEPLDNEDVRAHYEKADLVLIGTYPGEPKTQVKASTSATAQVVVLDDKPNATLVDAIKTARDFLLEREKDKREGGDFTYPNTKIDFVQDKTLHNIDDPIGKGLGAGQVQKLLVENEKDRLRYVVLRIVNHPSGTVMLWLECDNRFRDYWDAEFMELLGTLEFKEK
jgi:hypothetical protein